MNKLLLSLLLAIVIFPPRGVWAQTGAGKSADSAANLTEAQKLKSQADDLEDKSAQAVDDGNIDEALDLMVKAVRLDPSAMRHMMYGSLLFGNGVSVYKNTDQQKGKEILRQAEEQLRRAIEGFDPNKDQIFLSRCYSLLGEMYLNAFGQPEKAKEYYKKAADLSTLAG